MHFTLASKNRSNGRKPVLQSMDNIQVCSVSPTQHTEDQMLALPNPDEKTIIENETLGY